MGCFSWTFADCGNLQNLTFGKKGYLYCPDGTTLEEVSYDGYGEFAGHDVYDLVADWNRKFLSEHPEFEILGMNQDKMLPISRAEWYSAYADLSKSREEVVTLAASSLHEWRNIGINIACYDWQNKKLPYPIKIAKEKGYTYQQLPASQSDSEQGSKWGTWAFQNVSHKIYEHAQKLSEDKVLENSHIGYMFANGKAEIFAEHYGSDNSENEILFSTSFLSHPTSQSVDIIKQVVKIYSYELMRLQNHIKNKNSEEGRIIMLFKDKPAWVCSVERKIEPCKVAVTGDLEHKKLFLTPTNNDPGICSTLLDYDNTMHFYESKEECYRVYASALFDQAEYLHEKARKIMEEAEAKASVHKTIAKELEEKAKKYLYEI